MDPQFAELLSRLGKLPFYLAHPQDNPQITTIALGIVVALGLIAAALMMLLYFKLSQKRQNHGAARQNHSSRPQAYRPRNRIAAAIVITSMAAIVLGLFSAGPYAISQPKFCQSCHQTKAAYESWDQAAHGSIGCLACHKSPGSVGTLELLALGAENLISAIVSDSDKSGRALVRTASCLRCHENVAKKTLIAGNIKVSHKEFQASIPACTSCHESSGHEKGAESTVGSPPGDTHTDSRPLGTVMDRCVSCHDGRAAFATCSGCHVKDIGRESEVNPDELPKISLSNPNLCSGCHEKDILRARQAAAKTAFPLVERVCTQCHTLDRLGTSGIGANGWATLLRRMELKGADIGPDDKAPILNYLQITYP